MKIESTVAVFIVIMIMGVGAISQVSLVFAESSDSSTKDANVISLWDVKIENGKAILWAKVKNTGTESLDSNCKVHFWVLGLDEWINDYVGSRRCTVNDAGEDTGPVSPGESRWYKYEWTIPNNAKQGTHNYWAIVKEGDDKISEWSSGKDFTITAKTQSAKVVELGKIDPTEAFQTLTLKAKVKNTGDTTLDSGCEVWFWVEGKGIEDHIWVGPVNCKGLSPGSSKWYEYDWSIPGYARETLKYWAIVYAQPGGRYVKISDWSSGESFNILSGFSKRKFYPEGFHVEIMLRGTDLDDAKNLLMAERYADDASNWIMEEYFGSLNTAEEIEEWARKLGIPIPPAAELTKELLKLGIKAKILLLITDNINQYHYKMYIYTFGPPYPAEWRVSGL